MDLLRGVEALLSCSRRLPKEGSMPIADHARCCEMLDRARRSRFVYPAIKVTSLTAANAVLLEVDGEVGSKKAYDPRTYLALAEAVMAERARKAVEELRAAGTTMAGASGGRR
jgi:fructose/tagatose bisphosphate aldolase